MSTVSLILDKIRVTSLADELEVSVDSSVSLICPVIDIPILEPSQFLALLRSGTVWVSRGNGCRLEFTILFNGHKVDHQSRETVIQNLSFYLRDTPLWSQISLDAKVHLPQSDWSNHSQPSFTIGLRHAFSTSSSLSSGGMELSAAADVKAPASVPCLQLRTVEICMKFSSSKTYHTKRSKGREYLRGLQLHPDSAESQQEEPSRLDAHSSGDGLFLHRRAITMHEDLYEDEEMLDEEMPSVYDDRLFSLPASQSSTASSLVSQSSQECQREGKGETDQNVTVSLNINSAQRMAEFALRTLIGGRQTKSQPEFKVLKPHSSQSLSQIAPALWSPGFLDAVSQRSRFVPTISHVFSKTCLSNAVSPSLRRKLTDLVSKEIKSSHAKPMNGDGDQGVTQDDLEGREISDTVDDIVQGRVWRMMQLSLYDPLAARRLRPPQNKSAQKVEGVMEESVIVDNAHEPHQAGDRLSGLEDDFSAFPEDEFDDLLDEGEGEADSEFEALFDDIKSESEIFEDLLDARAPDGSQDGIDGPCEMDRIDEDMIERNLPAVRYWNDALDIDGTNVSDEMDFVADMDEEMQVDNQNMLL